MYKNQNWNNNKKTRYKYNMLKDVLELACITLINMQLEVKLQYIVVNNA